MFSFLDLNEIPVDLSFEEGTFSLRPRHVLIIVKYENKWLLTKHPIRGIEFPGGKVEEGETLIEAAIRETYEETNVKIKDIEWVAEYLVRDEPPFCKAVFRGKVNYIGEEATTFETDGPIWLTTEEFYQADNLSFHMKDEGMKAILGKVVEDDGKWDD